jgi:hypothetical protein
MNWTRWERFAPLSGIVAVALWIIGTIVIESTDLSDKEKPDEILAVFKDDPNTIIAGGLLFAFGVLFFIWFLGSLRAALYTAEGGVGRLSSIAYGSGMLAALSLIFQVAPDVTAGFDHDDLSPDAAQALHAVGEAAFGGTQMTLIAMTLAVGLVILRTRVLWTWLGWVSLALALLIAIIPIGWAGVVFVFPLWTIATSLALYMRGAPDATPPPMMTREETPPAA